MAGGIPGFAGQAATALHGAGQGRCRERQITGEITGCLLGRIPGPLDSETWHVAMGRTRDICRLAEPTILSYTLSSLSASLSLPWRSINLRHQHRQDQRPTESNHIENNAYASRERSDRLFTATSWTPRILPLFSMSKTENLRVRR